MSAIAIALIKKGYSVSGSDLIKNDEIKKLKKLVKECSTKLSIYQRDLIR